MMSVECSRMTTASSDSAIQTQRAHQAAAMAAETAIRLYLDPNQNGLAYSAADADDFSLSGCAGPNRETIANYGADDDEIHMTDLNAAVAALAPWTTDVTISAGSYDGLLCTVTVADSDLAAATRALDKL